MTVKQKNYFRFVFVVAAAMLSLQVMAQKANRLPAKIIAGAAPDVRALPAVIYQEEQKSLPGLVKPDAIIKAKTPDSRYYTANRRGNVTTYFRKPEITTALQRKLPRLVERDSVNVTVIFKYDAADEYNPDVYFYNSKGDFISSSDDEHGDSLTMRIPVDTFDILNSVQSMKYSQSVVIKELISITKDTTILFDQSEATELVPVIAYSENGTKLSPYLYHYINEAPYYERIHGNANGILEQYIYLKDVGVISNHTFIGLMFFDLIQTDSTVYNQGQLSNWKINKLSDRYSLIAATYLNYGDNDNLSELFAGRLRREGSAEGAVANDPNDCIIYEETFQPTPLGRQIGKYAIGYDGGIMFDGIPDAGASCMIPVTNDKDHMVRVHIASSKQIGIQQNAADIYLNMTFGDKQNLEVYTSSYMDENGNIVTQNDTTITYSPIYGETFMQNGNTVEYFDNGHSIFGNNAFQRLQGSNHIYWYPGHKAFSAQADKRKGVYGNSAPILSMMSQNFYYDNPEAFQGKIALWSPAYIGRLGEVRMTDDNFSHMVAQYNGSIVFETDTLSLSEEFNIQWAEEGHEDGLWRLTLTDNNVAVDSVPGKNVATITYDQRKDDWTAPTLQMLNFVTSDGTVTDRFANASEGTLQFAGGDFNYHAGDDWYFDCMPMNVKVEYSPYDEDKWADFNVEEDPSLYTMPAFGYFYRGQLSQVKGNSSNGWFDLRITLTDESGNEQQQVVSPAFRIDNLSTGISSVKAVAQPSDNRIFDLQGRQISHPAHGIYIMNGKKYVVK